MTVALWAVWSVVKRAGYFVIDNWRIVVPAVVLIVAGLFVWRACGPKPPKLNEKEIQESITAIEQKNDAVLREILVTAEVREKQIDDNLANAKADRVNAVTDARKRYSNMNTADLAAEIERLK